MKIRIIVRGGLVQAVYSSEKNIDLDVIDLDADDEEISENNEADVRGLDLEVEAGDLFIIW